jgi:hypothetical protein
MMIDLLTFILLYSKSSMNRIQSFFPPIFLLQLVDGNFSLDSHKGKKDPRDQRGHGTGHTSRPLKVQ